MFVVVDANRVLSSLLTKGSAFNVFLINGSVRRFEFIAPEFMFFEIGRNLDEIVKRSKLSRGELARIFAFIKKEIEFIPFKEFNEYADRSLAIAPHKKDVHYFALALKFDCGLWSNEVAFRRQTNVKIFSDDELMRILKL